MISSQTAAWFFYVMLGAVLHLTYGTYHPQGVLILAGSFAVFAVAMLSRRPTPNQSAGDAFPFTTESILLGVWALACVQLAVSPRLVTATGDIWEGALRASLGLLALGSTWAFLSSVRDEEPVTIPWSALGLASGLILAARVATLWATPEPQIDVFVTNSLACDYLAEGVNPYSAWYPDIYDGKFGYAPGFFYWPAYLIWAAPYRWLLLDIRYAAFTADIVTAFSLGFIALKAGAAPRMAALCGLIWLSHPASLLVMELAWIDPVLIAAMAVCLLLLVHEKWLGLGLLLGTTAAVKQYGGVAAALYFPYLWIRHRERLPGVFLITGLSWAAWLSPFVFNDAGSFLSRTVGVYLHAPARSDSLSLVSWLKHGWDWQVPGGLLLVLYLATLAGAVAWLTRVRELRPADLMGATAVVFGVVFLCGRLAFCNYYFVVAFLTLAYCVLSLRPPSAASGNSPIRRPATC